MSHQSPLFCFIGSDLNKTVSEIETRAKEISDVKRDLEMSESEKASKLKDLEKELRTIKLEKEDTTRELSDAQDKLKQQSKELKDAVAQRKLAMSEYAEVTDKLSELRQHKQKLSRQARNLHCFLEIIFPFLKVKVSIDFLGAGQGRRVGHFTSKD